MKHEKLAKELGLSDVYAIATGAMFSSGFFLLPGIAAAIPAARCPVQFLPAKMSHLRQLSFEETWL